MTRTLRSLALSRRYATNRNDLVADFYAPCLNASFTYDRAVGYFTSTVFLLATDAVLRFAQAGGRIRVVCSPQLTGEDIDALESGYDWSRRASENILRIIETALRDENTRGLIQVLATLVALGCLDLKLAFRPGERGIFHDKLGIFTDTAGDSVSFTGSSNETLAAWDAHGNHESFDVFSSWTIDIDRVREHRLYFESLWDSNEPGVETIPFPDVAKERLVQVAHERGLEGARESLKATLESHHLVLRPHQEAALQAWEDHGGTGILEHATGAGKTITGLAAIRAWLKRPLPALIIVPSELLLNQWLGEATRELLRLSPKTLVVGAGHNLWRGPEVLEGFTAPDAGCCITIATLQTASSEEFLSRVSGGSHLMVVIDEVHRAGSESYSNVFTLGSGRRLGLSATPTRFGDPDGTAKIWSYFGGVVHTFTLGDAVAAGALCRYTYFVHPVELSQSESAAYTDLSERIARALSRRPDDNGAAQLEEHAKLLLIQRARITKKAGAKIPAAVQILADQYRDGHRWLLYCDDQSQLGEVLAELRGRSLPAAEYHSAMAGDRRQTLRHFEQSGGLLVAIRCLDEGVDIPQADHALILASSPNPREFIQRRGRLLRTAPNKHMASIHDLLVTPPDNLAAPALALGELRRAALFAQYATNSSVRLRLRQLANDYGLVLDDILDIPVEDETTAALIGEE